MNPIEKLKERFEKIPTGYRAHNEEILSICKDFQSLAEIYRGIVIKNLSSYGSVLSLETGKRIPSDEAVDSLATKLLEAKE